MTIDAISPDDTRVQKMISIPDIIIDAINELIIKNAIVTDIGSTVIITQNEILYRVYSKDSSMTSQRIFDNRWLDIEDIYREKGWDVKYEKPGYNETFNGYFTFKYVKND